MIFVNVANKKEGHNVTDLRIVNADAAACFSTTESAAAALRMLRHFSTTDSDKVPFKRCYQPQLRLFTLNQ